MEIETLACRTATIALGDMRITAVNSNARRWTLWYRNQSAKLRTIRLSKASMCFWLLAELPTVDVANLRCV